MSVASHYLRGLLQVEARFVEAQTSKAAPIGELPFDACHVARRARDDLSRCSEDLACAEADLRSSQVRAAALEACVKALHISRAIVLCQAPPLKYGTSYGSTPMLAAPSYAPGSRSREASYDES